MNNEINGHQDALAVEKTKKPETDRRPRFEGFTFPDPEPSRPSSQNADEFFMDDEGGNFFGVMDGKGDSINAAKASEKIKEHMTRVLPKIERKAFTSPTEVADYIQNEIRIVHQQLFELNKGKNEKNDFEATFVMVYLWTDSSGQQYAINCHVGDSRSYLADPNDFFRQITLDDGSPYFRPEHDDRGAFAKEFFAASEIEKYKLQYVLSRARAKEDLNVYRNEKLRTVLGSKILEKIYKHRNIISQAIGGPLRTVHTRIERVFPGQKILLCSDGVSDNLSHDELAQIFADYDDVEEIRDAIEMRAREVMSGDKTFRRKPDDCTAVVIEIPYLEHELRQIDEIARWPELQGTKIAVTLDASQSGLKMGVPTQEAEIIAILPYKDTVVVSINGRQEQRRLADVFRLNTDLFVDCVRKAESIEDIFLLLRLWPRAVGIRSTKDDDMYWSMDVLHELHRFSNDIARILDFNRLVLPEFVREAARRFIVE